LAVPLRDGDDVLGVLNVESPRVHAFDSYDQETLQALAELAVIAIKNLRQFEELKHTKGLIGSRSALAWMGMMSALWRHSIEGYALTIRDTVPLLRDDLEESANINEKLERIEHSANEILEKAIISPLSSSEGVISISVKRLIRDRVQEFERSSRLKELIFEVEDRLTAEDTVRASLEWLRRVIDLLVENAARAMVSTPRKLITFLMRYANGGIEIIVRDTGPGISTELLPDILQVPIRKPQGSTGMGIGLLIAQAIVEAFGGRLSLESTGPNGTSFVLWLPVEKNSL
jgi:signal transduction histidine kinase